MLTPLPPVDLRQGGHHFLDDRDFIRSGIADVEKLRSAAGLNAQSRVLDLGCGPGRLAIGLIEVGWFEGSYLGLEVQDRHVRWCSEQITPRFPAYRFELVDSTNERYNPDGLPIQQLPVPDGSVDVFYAYSVFTHMRGHDVAGYLAEIARVLAPSGRAFITVFCESDVPDETENPSWWGPMKWKGPLHCVLYSVDWIERAVGHAGLVFQDFRKGAEVDRQTGLVLSIRDGRTH